MKWLELGTYLTRDDNIEIDLYEGYEKALVKLGLFSHCLLILLKKDSIDIKVVKIISVDEKKGFLVAEGVDINGQLIDIKPYFPNEEVVLAAKSRDGMLVKYENDTVGEYRVSGHESFIQLNKKMSKKVENGDYLRIIWWFHRFDKDSFRKNRMCHPPYNHAPKTGIFATRSPVRPNPIASTVVKVTGYDHENKRIAVQGFDGFPGSKLLQVMFYNPDAEIVQDAALPEWVDHWTGYKQFQKPKDIEIKDEYEVKDDYLSPDIVDTMATERVFMHDKIQIHDAHIHNLKHVSIGISKNEITLITGVSGSGKSSLAFDTLFSESQKQFMDLVLSNHMDDNALVDSKVGKITGLQPAIAIKQKNLGMNPRSTVGSATRIVEFMRLLFTTVGVRVCPNCHKKVDASNVCSCGNILFDPTPQLFSYNHPDYMCPVCKGLGVEMQVDETLIVEHPERSLLDKASSLYGDLRKHRKKPNANWMRGEILALADDMKIDLETPYDALPEVFKNQFLYGSDGRKVSLSYETSKGRSGVITRPVEGAVNVIKRLTSEGKSKTSLEVMKRYMSKKTCSRCKGERLREEGRLVHIHGTRYPEVMKMSLDKLKSWCHLAYRSMSDIDKKSTLSLFQKIHSRLERIEAVGLFYLSLDRSIPSLSGGEAQRLKLATQFGTGLSNILYIMDEPSKGLHPKDYAFLMDAIVDLKNCGNTIVMVEHKKAFQKIADTHITMGPKAGKYGGEVLSITTDHERDIKEDHVFVLDKIKYTQCIHMIGVTTNNLKSVEAKIPIGKKTAVIGVSGSGKSSLIAKTLLPFIENHLGKKVDERGQCEIIKGLEMIDDVSYVNQKAIGSNSRSNPGTYTGVLDLIRKCYGSIKPGYGKEFFSFNSKKGQCPVCQGLGEIAVDMHYMEDIFVPCRACGGKRYNDDVLEIKRKDYSIGDILEMEISDLMPVFEDEQEIYDKLNMLVKVGLGYLNLGQSASTLSGGEAQRIKLAKELYRKSCKGMLYILDEPTTGLHSRDTEKIIKVLDELNEMGATIILVSHNRQMIHACDYVIELGPGGGHMGGTIVRQGQLSRADL